MQRTAEADLGGVMIALVPSPEAVERLLDASGGTEPADQVHITLAYLGTLGEEIADDDVTRDQVYNTVLANAARFVGLNGEVSGWGIFNNDEDVVVALWNIPGINGLRQALVSDLHDIGIPPKNNYSFNPHSTMGYYDAGEATLPPAVRPAVKSDFRELVLSWGHDEWIRVPLSGRRIEASTVTARDYTRGGNPDNPGQFSTQDRGHRKKDRSEKEKAEKAPSGDGKGKEAPQATPTQKSRQAPSQAPQRAPQRAPQGQEQAAPKAPSHAGPHGPYKPNKEIVLPAGVSPDLTKGAVDANGAHTGADYMARSASTEVFTEADKIAVGDKYGQYLPAGKYLEGDPRNEPEFEQRMAMKTALAAYYEKETVPFDHYPNEKKGEDHMWVDPANADKLREWRQSGEGGQTIDLYNRIYPEGKKEPIYTEERSRLHQSIMKKMVDRYKGYPRNGKCVVMAGPPGAGKSTFLENYGKKEFGLDVATDEEVKAGANPFHNAVVINPDDFKEMLPVDMSRYEGLEENEVALITHEESSFLAKRVANYFMSRGYDVVIDITLGSANSAWKKYYRDFSDNYEYSVALVDGDMANSRNNAGLRWKRPDKKTGKRTYSGRFLPMGLIEHNAPTKPGFRSKNASEFLEFIKNEKVVHSGVYDPYNPDAGFQPSSVAYRPSTTASLSGILREERSGALRREGADMAQTGKITEIIEAFRNGQKTEEDLVSELIAYPYKGKDACPFEPGTPEWWQWHEDDGYDYDTYDEVIRAVDVGLMSWDLFHRINDAMVAKWAVGH